MVDRSIDHPLQPKRRWFLKTALAIGTLGGALGGLVYWHRGTRDGKLTEHGRDVLRGLTLAFVGPMLPKDKGQRDTLIEAHLAHTETFLNGMPNVLQVEISALLGLLGNYPTRALLTGMGAAWADATEDELAQALEVMRLNPLPTTRLTYQSLRAVVCMSFFSNSAHWPLTGYPGPVQI